MPQKKPKGKLRCPPELFWIYVDAAAIGATQFWLEDLPHAVMASFSVPTRADEIDFTFEAGREMLDYLSSLPGVRERGGVRGVLEYRKESVPRTIEVEVKGQGRERFRVAWQNSNPPTKGTPCSA